MAATAAPVVSDHKDYLQYLPAEKTVDGTRYKLSRVVGRGTRALVALYASVSNPSDLLSAKVSYCNDPAGRAAQQAKVEQGRKVVALGSCPKACGACRATDLAQAVRVPRLVDTSGPCVIEFSTFLPTNLREWLVANSDRTPAQVQSVFLQVLDALLCLRSKGYWYNDVKLSNFLVTAQGDVVIGDLNGLDAQGQSSISFTPALVPPRLTRNLFWSTLDPLASFLLGDLVLELLLVTRQNPQPLAQFYRCIQGDDVDDCLQRIVAQLQTHLAPQLSLQNPKVLDLATMALMLMGYHKSSATLPQLRALPSEIFTT